MTAPLNTEGSNEQRPLTQLDLAEDFPEAVVDGVAEFLGKPRARGWIHVYSAIIAAIAGATLVAVSWSVDSTRAGIATLIYTITIVAMFTVSGTYHRVNWRSPTAYKWMKRLDHSMIFIFIAGSYTPFALLALPQHRGWLLFWIVWGGATAGVALKMLWPSAPRWLGVPLYILLGWVAAWFIGPIMQGAGVAAVVLLIVGALCAQVAESLAGDIRPSRVLPRLHGRRCDLPLHRDVVRRLLTTPPVEVARLKAG